MANQLVHLGKNQHVTVTALPESTDGQEGTLLPGVVPTWSATDTTLVTVAAAEDGLSAVVTAEGKAGTTEVSIGAPTVSGGPVFTFPFDVIVDSEPADHFEFSFGTPATNS